LTAAGIPENSIFANLPKKMNGVRRKCDPVRTGKLRAGAA
jgi:hypothetical protein